MTPDQKPNSHSKDSHGSERDATKHSGVHPVVMVMIGMVLALGVFIALYAIDFTPMDLTWSMPVLVLSAFLVFSGSRKLHRK